MHVSARKNDCENYNLTTTVETTDDDEDEEIMNRKSRRKQKKKTLRDCLTGLFYIIYSFIQYLAKKCDICFCCFLFCFYIF